MIVETKQSLMLVTCSQSKVPFQSKVPLLVSAQVPLSVQKMPLQSKVPL